MSVPALQRPVGQSSAARGAGARSSAARPAPPRGSAPHTSTERASAPRTRRPALRPVSAPATVRSRVPFVVLCVTLLVAALLGALVLNTTMAKDAYEVRSLDIEIARLAEREQDLAAELERLGSPQNLAETARALGMVPAPSLAFLRLSDGAVLGSTEAG